MNNKHNKAAKQRQFLSNLFRNVTIGAPIPELAMRGKERVTVGQVITHMDGLGMAQPPVPIEHLRT